jgi:hypothetical protein
LKNKIHIENYEAFLLDWTEGNLSQEDIVLLKQFLEKHPELAVNTEFYESTLTVSSEKFNQKSALKKSLTNDDYIAYHEGELSKFKKQEVEEFVDTNSHAKKEFELYAKLKLQPQPIVFENKQALKKKGIVFPFKRMAYYASSAAAIWLLAIWLLPQTQQYSPKAMLSYQSEIENEEPLPTDNNATVTQAITSVVKSAKQHTPKTPHVETINEEKINDDNLAQLNTHVNLTPIEQEINSELKHDRSTYDNFATNDVASVVAKKSSTRYLTPKQYLISKFKRNVLNVEEDDTELEVEDFGGVLANISNEKITLQKRESGQHLTINTKYFSFDKKISN